MARATKIFLIAAAVLAAIALAGAFFLLRTTPGRAALKPMVERALGDKLGVNATIGAIAGALPDAVTLSDVTLSGADGVFLEIDRVRMDWRARALLDRKVEIESLAFEGGGLRQRPPKREPDGRPRGFELPENLPQIDIGRLTVTDFIIDAKLTGAPLKVSANGDAHMGGRALDVSLDAASAGERDEITVRVKREGDSASANASARSSADGALAAIFALKGPLNIAAKGEGPLTNWRLALNAEAGAYGEVAARLSSDLTKIERIAFDIDAQPGDRLAMVRQVFGDNAHASGDFAPTTTGGALTFSSLTGAFGELKGRADWANRGEALATLSFDASTRFAEEWRPDLRRRIGVAARLSGKIEPDGDRYRIAAALAAQEIHANIDNAETDLRTFLTGPARLRAPAAAFGASRWTQTIEAEGTLDYRKGERLSWSNLTLAAGADSAFKGKIALDLQSRTFDIEGDATLGPRLLASIEPRIALSGRASAVLSVKGTRSDFTARIAGTTPSLRINKTPLPPTRVTLALTGAPSSPGGSFSARSLDGSRKLSANFAKTGDVWSAKRINFAGPDFSATGALAFDPARRSGEVDLVYRGGAKAEPMPGYKLAGDATAQGSIGAGAIRPLILNIESLATAQFALDGVTARLEGPTDAMRVDASARAARINGLAPLESVKARLGANFAGPPRIVVSTLAARIDGEKVFLRAPAHIAFTDGVELKDFDIAIGADGGAALEAKLSKSRWQGAFSVRRLPIANGALIVDARGDVDTDNSELARGEIKFASDLVDGDDARIAAQFVWDGRNIKVASSGDGALRLDLSLPARLVRARALRFDMSGALAGKASYKGRAETLAAFLPLMLQSVEGDVNFAGEASGTLEKPMLKGALAIANGAYTELSSGLSFVNIEGTARSETEAGAPRIRFEATARGAGQEKQNVIAAGEFTIGRDARIDARLKFDRTQLAAGPASSAVASGEISLTGPMRDILANGALTVASMEADIVAPEPTGLVAIDVVRKTDAGEPAATTPALASPARVSLDLRIKASDSIFVRDRGLNSEWKGDLSIGGHIGAPILAGSLSMLKGDLEFSGRKFKVSRGAIDFDRLIVNNPTLDIRTERRTQDGTLAAVVVSGRANAPVFTLESTPAKPPEDIMALLLFDRPAQELTALQSLQAAEGLAELGGVGLFGGKGVAGAARDALGLDVLSIDLKDAKQGASALTIGKYVTDNVLVSATQDARGENGSVRVEFEVVNSVTVETELHQDGEQTVSTNWKHDF